MNLIKMYQIIFSFFGLAFSSFFSLGQTLPPEIKLKDYRPQSIFKIPETQIEKARYPLIDLHSHDRSSTKKDIDEWIKTMNKAGVAKSIILTYTTGAAFDSIAAKYASYPDRFVLFCGFDYTGYNNPGWPEHALKELERCHKMGAKGVGELGDKGKGLFYSKPTPAYGMHLDDPRMKPLLKKCAELHMPISVHVSDPIWMYEPMDSTNDGLMNAYEWKIDETKNGILNHEQLVNTLKNAVKENPKTTFIACHLANCVYDLNILGAMLDQYPNLFADIAARYEETATIPRFIKAFYEKYQDRLVYGTDMGHRLNMYRSTFRVLESADEHFYQEHSYHWPLYGLVLSDTVLKKIYRDNALKVLKP
ncbi:MAG: amidohydrolase family protein [Ginsengibacter sp.]